MDWLEAALGAGKGPSDISILEMGARAVLIYLVILAMVRMGKKRFMSQASAFDMIVGIIMGSIASRAITGNAPIVPALGACAAMLLLHSTLTAIAVRWHGFGGLIKGGNRLLVKDGKVDEDELCKAHMTNRDLDEALREQGIDEPAKVAEARLERNGKVSIIKRSQPHIHEVAVAPGVQTVRIEIS
jgi:uncharacterized membrane protein YcaP (DUF421 family)